MSRDRDANNGDITRPQPSFNPESNAPDPTQQTGIDTNFRSIRPSSQLRRVTSQQGQPDYPQPQSRRHPSFTHSPPHTHHTTFRNPTWGQQHASTSQIDRRPPSSSGLRSVPTTAHKSQIRSSSRPPSSSGLRFAPTMAHESQIRSSSRPPPSNSRSHTGNTAYTSPTEREQRIAISSRISYPGSQARHVITHYIGGGGSQIQMTESDEESDAER